MTDLWTEIEGRMKLMDVALKEAAARGQLWAKAESDYRAALKEEELQLKADGHPATLIKDLARGSKRVAPLRLDRDCKRVLYESAQEALQVYKMQARLLNDEMAREWANEGRN